MKTLNQLLFLIKTESIEIGRKYLPSARFEHTTV